MSNTNNPTTKPKSNTWIEQVKAYAAKHGISYKQAMTQLSEERKKTNINHNN